MAHNFQKGVTLYFAVVITTMLLAIVLGLTTILVSQLKIIKGMGDSVIAFFAADTGMEETLYNIYGQGKLDEASSSWDGGNREYDTTISIEPFGGVTSTVVQSGGRYKGIRRAIQTSLIDVTSPLITECSITDPVTGEPKPTGSPGDEFDISVRISGLSGVKLGSEFADIEQPKGIWYATASFQNIDDITYKYKWDSAGSATTTYWVVIKAEDNDDRYSDLDCGTIKLED